MTKTFTGSVVCSNAAFGDPAHGQLKSCSYSSNILATSGTTGTSSTAPTNTTSTTPVATDAGWTTCAAEGGTCTFSGTRQVRFGVNGYYATKIVTGSVTCTIAVFGDPAYRMAKTCSYSNSTK